MSPTGLQMDSDELPDGLAEAVLLGVAIFAAICAVASVVAVLGCWYSYRAARGSTTAWAGWLVIRGFEVQVIAAAPVYDGVFQVIMLFPAMALVAQAAVYVIARHRKDRESEPDPQPISRPGDSSGGEGSRRGQWQTLPRTGWRAAWAASPAASRTCSTPCVTSR